MLYIFNFICTDHIWRRKKNNLDGPDGFKHYWRDLRGKKKRYFSRRNFGGGSIMVWGAVKYSLFEKIFVI